MMYKEWNEISYAHAHEWMVFVHMKCKCQMKCLTLGCYTIGKFVKTNLQNYASNNL